MSNPFSITSPLYGLAWGQFEHLEADDKKLLLRIVAMCCEQSFRRGFQQGWDSKARGDKVCDLEKWRFATSLSVSVSPHGTYHSTSLERLKMECHLHQVGLRKMEETFLTKEDINTWIAPLFQRAFKRASLSKRLRFDILRRDGFRCRYCGATGDQSTLHVDHVIPRADGGQDSLENLVTACVDCNLGKGRSTANVPCQSNNTAGDASADGPVAFGFEAASDGRLVQNDAEQLVIRRIAECRAAGMSLRAIAEIIQETEEATDGPHPQH